MNNFAYFFSLKKTTHGIRYSVTLNWGSDIQSLRNGRKKGSDIQSLWNQGSDIQSPGLWPRYSVVFRGVQKFSHLGPEINILPKTGHFIKKSKLQILVI